MLRDDDADELAALAKELDAPAPDEPRVEAIRASLLRAADEDKREPKSRWPLVAGGFTAGALAAAASVMMVMHTGHAPIAASNAEHRAQIEASAAADFERQVTHGLTGTDEIVRLHAGRISLAVSGLAAGDRVWVAAKNGEIEGEGQYEVAVTEDLLREVTVKQGTARIRIAGQREVFLAMGQTWRAPVVTAEVQPAPVIRTPSPDVATASPMPRTLPAPRSPARAPEVPRLTAQRDTVAETKSVAAGVSATTPIDHPAAPSVPAMQTMADASPNEAPPAAITQIPKTRVSTTPVEQHFATGWQLLRAGKNAEAARELAAAADAGGDDPLAGDARYFEAVALTKAGRKTEAEHALVAFLDRSPHALRRGRAAVMLARLIAERGDRAAARTWFEAASHDPDPDVAAAAKAGLAGP